MIIENWKCILFLTQFLIDLLEKMYRVSSGQNLQNLSFIIVARALPRIRALLLKHSNLSEIEMLEDIRLEKEGLCMDELRSVVLKIFQEYFLELAVDESTPSLREKIGTVFL